MAWLQAVPGRICLAGRQLDHDYLHIHFTKEYTGQIQFRCAVDCIRNFEPRILHKHWSLNFQ
jgi:hypothetical protein